MTDTIPLLSFSCGNRLGKQELPKPVSQAGAWETAAAKTPPRATPFDKLRTGLGGLIPAYAHCLAEFKIQTQVCTPVFRQINHSRPWLTRPTAAKTFCNKSVSPVSKLIASVSLRNQVNWRLANCRVAIIPFSVMLSRSSSPFK